VTVYDCFRSGRRRVDSELVVDIAGVLDVPEPLLEVLRRQCAVVQEAAALPVSAHRGIPVPVDDFIGRTSQAEACARTEIPALIVGMAGVGKTQVASRALRVLLDEGGAASAVAVSMAVASGSGRPEGGDLALGAIARALGLPNHPGASAAERADSIVRELRDSRTALLIDDVTRVDQVEALLAAGPSTPVMICSRFDLALAGAGIARVAIEPWTPQEGMDYLRAVVGGERVSAEADAAAELVSLAGGLPLAMSLTAARLRQHPEWTLADHAAALRERMVGLRLDDVIHESIDLSYTALSTRARRMLRLLGIQPCAELLPEWIGALCALEPADTDAVIDEVARAHCLIVDDDGRVSVHSLVRTYSAARSWDEDPERERDSALDRLAASILSQAWVAIDELHPGLLWRRRSIPAAGAHRAPVSAVEFLALALDPLARLAESSVQRAPHITVEVGAALSRHLDNVGLYHVGRTLHQQALTAARSLDDLVGETLAHLDLGQNAVRLGLPDAGRHLETAARLAELAAVPRASVAASNALGILAAQAGDNDAALARFVDSLETARANDFTEQIAPLTDNIAILLRRKGDLQGAIEHHRASHDDALRRDDEGAAARTLANMSELQLLMGDIDGAVESATSAMAMATRLGIAITKAYATSSLGLALAESGDPASALRLFDEARDAARAMGNHDLEASAMNGIGAVRSRPGDLHDGAAARSMFLSVLELAAREPLHLERAKALHGLALLEADAGDIPGALARIDEALSMLGESDAPEARALRADAERFRASA
jgi:tetratricopeptide (TPR) repeat protein